jgi:transposase-like protein
MKEKTLDRFKFSDDLKEKLVMLVVYQNHPIKELSRQYGLPNAHILVNWVNAYKKSLEKGAITLPPMQPKDKKDTPALKQRIKQLEKSLEKANVMIYGLNAMIDYAEKELKVPVRKKPGTKQ